MTRSLTCLCVGVLLMYQGATASSWAELRDQVLVIDQEKTSVREVHRESVLPGQQEIIFTHFPDTMIPDSLEVHSSRGRIEVLSWRPVEFPSVQDLDSPPQWPVRVKDAYRVPPKAWAMSCRARSQGPITFELSYLCTGITWTAQYELGIRFTTNLKERVSCDVRAQIEISNQTDATFDNAYLRLLQNAVEVNERDRDSQKSSGFLALDPDSPLADRWLDKDVDYGIREAFKLPRRVTLAPRQVQFVTLVKSSRSKATRLYRFAGGTIAGGNEERMRLRRIMRLHNTTENGLGWAFPSGVVNVFSAGNRRPLAGAGRMKQTRTGEYMEIDLGPSEDLLAEALPVERGSRREGQMEIHHRIRIDNSLPFTVPVQWEHDPDSSLQWRVLNSNAEDTLEDGVLTLSHRVPAEETRVLDFTLEFVQPAL